MSTRIIKRGGRLYRYDDRGRGLVLAPSFYRPERPPRRSWQRPGRRDLIEGVAWLVGVALVIWFATGRCWPFC